ncbi:WD repeat-containing protein jip5 [Orbilia ellipsospora]|uniref:WD repeat-containing protein JIP5 n=1 Tax=Orbilia ellipsospora TaxID=2528407 RepID=A0AAV9XT09_9PEZI
MDNFKSHSIPFQSSIFTLTAHPSEPLFTAGLLSGHVYTYTWPKEVPSDDDEHDEQNADALPGGYKVAWKTRRHKGSCRSAAYSNDGQVLYSAGTDSIIKCASTTTGQVISKAVIPASTSSPDNPTHLHPLNPHHLLLGTDSGTVHLYDTRTSLLPKPTTTWTSIHEDYISSITSVPPTSESTSNLPKQFVTTGDSTVSFLDVRKGLVTKSDDQENETLSSCVVSGVGKGGRSTRAYVGMGDGIIHAFERGVWGDMCERVKIGGKGIEVDVVREYTQDGDEEVRKGRCIVAGCGDGSVKVVRLGGNKVVRVFEHGGLGEDGEEEGISGISFDCDGAMMTAGGRIVKIWYQDDAGADDDGKDEDEEEDKQAEDGYSDNDSDDSDDSDKPAPKTKGRKLESDSEDSNSDSGSKSSQRRKKRRKNKHQTGGPKKTLFKGLD